MKWSETTIRGATTGSPRLKPGAIKQAMQFDLLFNCPQLQLGTIGM